MRKTNPRLYVWAPVVTSGLLLAAFVLVNGTRGQESESPESGRVRVVRRHEPAFDKYTNSPDESQQEWMRTHFWRFAAFSTYFDSRLRWYPNAWLYANLYGVHRGSAVTRDHPEWILRDASGRNLFVPWGCADGRCPLYAADVSNPEYRRWWIDETKRKLARGYRGVWLDDVNLMFRVGNGQQSEVAPFDSNAGSVMTFDTWRRSVAEFLEQIRAELPDHELVHNSLWFAGPSDTRHLDPYVRRQILACDYVNVERGVSDDGLTGGNGQWSLSALFRFIDYVHELGKGVILDELETGNLEYALAAYFLISTGRDAIGEFVTTPDNWYGGYDVNLGVARSERYVWQNLLRRDFKSGIVLLNEPGAPIRNVELPDSFLNMDGKAVRHLSLGSKAGAVLRYDSTKTQ